MVAAEAYKRAVRLSEHSCFERADDYLNLRRSVASLWEQNQEQAKSLRRDALKALTEYDQRFAKSPEVKAQRMLVECQRSAGQGDTIKSERLLAEAEALPGAGPLNGLG